jgi:serine/threonine protein kinase/predicted negative regulator of RcsB-dependent stress response
MSGESDPSGTGIEETLAPGLRSTSGAEPGSEAPKRIGPYRLLQLIGEGGMGEVWLAEQVEPIRRRVAFKVIKAGMDTKQVVARFESERQALALMDHPAIAKVFDGGSTPEGRPYFVMEYVPGVPITEHCDTHKLSTAARLELLAEVCEGVQHAHQKAIIHRDLKPSNVLVSLVDGKAQPKIIDFGIAKATGYRLTEKTLFTELGAIMGTLEYMSPEQADLTGQDVDTRTDVYSLGVILYQLLTGELPFGPKELRSSGYDELRRTLKEVDPPRPSTRLSTLGAAGADAARNRGTEPAALRRQLEGDLDAVTMKALEKERARRYGSPSDLAADVRRHLRHEPVLARAPSRLYRLERYVRRHRLGVGIATGLVLLVLGFGAMMGLEARRVARERDRANAERDRANAWVQHAKDFAEKPIHDHSQETSTLSRENSRTLDALVWKGRYLIDRGQFAEAETVLRDTLALERGMTGEEGGPFTIWARSQLAEAQMQQGRLHEAEATLRDTFRMSGLLATAGANKDFASFILARVLVRQGKQQEAFDALQRAMDDGMSGRVLELPMYGMAGKFETDADFQVLRQAPAYQSLFSQAEKRHQIAHFIDEFPEPPPFEERLAAALALKSKAPQRTHGDSAPGLRWVPSEGAPQSAPYDTGPAGKEQVRAMWVCRGLFTAPGDGGALAHSLIVGKTWSGADGCKVPLSGFEVTFSKFERLVGRGGTWKVGRNHSFPPRSVIGGYSADGLPFIICMAETSDGATHPGALLADGRSNCTFGYGGTAEERSSYQVLTTADDSVPNTQERQHGED